MGNPSIQMKKSDAAKSPDHDRTMTESRPKTHLRDRMSYGVLIGPLSCCLSCQFYDIWKWNPRKALRRVTESQIEKLYLPNHKHRNEKRHKITAWSTVWNTLAGTHRWSDGASPIVEQLRWHRYPQWACAPCYFEEHAKSISFFKITLRDRVWPTQEGRFVAKQCCLWVLYLCLNTESRENILSIKIFLYITIR